MLKVKWLVLALCLMSAPAFAWLRGGGTPGAGPLVEIGSGYTLVNNGSTASNVPVRFGYGFARGDMPLGNTIVCKDEAGTTYPCQIDQLSTRSGMPNATDTPGWLHATVSLLYTPSWTASATHTFHIYKQSGTYTAGTGLATSALTGAHDYQVIYQNVKDFAGRASGPYTCDLNKAIAAGARTGTGAGVDGGGGGYTITENGQVETTIEAWTPAENGTTPHGQIMCAFYAMLWQTSPGSGTLGQVELAAWIGEPWQNSATGNLGFYWGDASLFDATSSTTLRNYSHATNFAPADIHLDPTTWDQSNNQNSIHYFGALCSKFCPGGGFNNTLTVSGGTISGASFGFNLFGSPFLTPYLYVGSGNTNCTAGSYQVTSGVTSGSFTINTTSVQGSGLGGSCTSISNWQIGSGNITNFDNLQTGEGISFSVTNGTLPRSLQAGQIYFAGTPVNQDGHNALDPYYIFAVPMGEGSDFWPESVGVSDAGTCNAGGSCFTVTRKVTLRPWSGNWLLSDDIGTPFWVAGNNPANAARLYPQLSIAQRNYWESTALFPPYNINSGFSVPSPPPIPIGNPNCNQNNGGVYYKPGAVGPNEVCINPGGGHMGIGMMGALMANWFLQPTQHPIDWDYVHTDALAEAGVPGSAVLNTETGYQTPLDCGLYPGCQNYPSTLQKSGVTSSAHSSDFLFSNSPTNYTNAQSGFTVSYTGDFSGALSSYDAKAYGNFLLGPYWDAFPGPDSWASHLADFGNPAAYLVGGEPWYLRSVQFNSNHALMAKVPQSGIPAGRDFTINGVHYYGDRNFGDQEQRGPAWGMREITYGALLGADNDPQKLLSWNYLTENVDYSYALMHLYYGQNINNVSGASADPNYESSGICGTEYSTGTSGFKYSYEATVVPQIYALTHYASAALPGASALYYANECNLFNIHQFSDEQTSADIAGHTVSGFWCCNDEVSSTLVQCNSYAPSGCPAALPNQVYQTAGEAGWRAGYIDTGGVVHNRSCYFDPNAAGRIKNGDLIRSSDLDGFGYSYNTLANNTYHAINVSPTGDNSGCASNTATFQLSTSSQACSSTTGSTGCPAPATLANLPCNQPCNLGWRPQDPGPSTGFAGYACTGVNCTEGYATEAGAALQEAVDAGLTAANLSTAWTNFQARFGTRLAGDQTNLLWQQWAMGPATIPGAPSQTIASLAQSPNPGSCATGATNSCTTVSATMSPSSPGFAADIGTFAIATSGCSGSDFDTNFSVDSSSGVVSISNTSVATGNYTPCVKAQTTAPNVTNSPQYITVAVTVTPIPSQTIASISQSPNPGTCANGATNSCTTVSATMSPASPTFASDGGSWTLVASGGSCSGGDTTDFGINASTGVVAITNTAVAPGSYTTCARAAATASNVTNSPQFATIPITVTSGGSVKTIVSSNQRCNADATGQVTTTCAMTVTNAGDLVAFGYTTCDANGGCNAGSPIPQITGVTYGAGSSGGSGATCAPGVATGTQSSGSAQTVGVAWVLCKNVTSTGTVTFTFTWNNGGAYYSTVYPIEISGASSTSPDMGIGNIGYVASGTSSVTTSGAVTQPNALVLDVCISPSAGTPVFGGSQTALNGATIDSVGTAIGKLTASPANGTSPTLTCTAAQSSLSLAHSVVAIQ